jgi:predicted metalloprotease with PDZ domain
VPEPIRYTIVPVDPAAHLFRVNCCVAAPDPAGQVFRLPAWIPGSYMIREFARNIVALHAECAGSPVSCEKTDKSSWRCAPVVGPLTVTCDVYAWDLSVRAAHLDDTHAYFNGTSVFLEVVGQGDAPCAVTLERPDGDRYARWRVATTLAAADGTPEWGFGAYLAQDYDELIDHPVEMGEFTQARFHAGGIPHDVVLTGVHRADMERICRDLARVCATQINFFGAPAPMSRYLFMVMVVGEGYGGLEHRSSTSLMVSRDDLPFAGEDADTLKDSYRTFLGLCSHEYFHTWHVKRIKPAAFMPYDLAQEAYTRQLWIFEGFTSYYDDLLLLRAGLITTGSYLELLGQTITRVLRGPGRHRQSVAESSFDAWTKFYRQDENAPNAIVSYYAKGSLVALALDLELRRRTGGARSLDDVMRLLWTCHGLAGRPVAEREFPAIVAEVLGEDVSAFLDPLVNGCAELPLPALLEGFGIRYQLRAADGQGDAGGKPGRRTQPATTLAMRTQQDALGVRIQHCLAGGPAMKAGLSAGDVILALNGLRVTHSSFEKLLASFRAGERLRIHAFRRDELREFDVEIDPAPLDTCWLSLESGEHPVLARGWLAGGRKD